MRVATWKDCRNEREKYALYLASREWSVLKEAVRERCKGICERCHHNPLEAVHHLTYARKYREQLDDLQAICRACHDFTHGKRQEDPATEHPRPTLFRSVLAGLIDLGTHEHSYQNQTRVVHRCLFCWELCGYRDADNGPLMVARGYNLTLEGNSKLRLMLEDWRGMPYREGERISITDLPGKPCMLDVRLNWDAHDQPFNRIVAIHPFPHDAAPPEPSVAPVLWSFGNGPAALPAWVPALDGETAPQIIGRSREARTARAREGSR